MDISKMLVDNEEAVANLYRAYASRFRNYADFWNLMAKEEMTHATIARRCRDELAEGLLQLDEKGFNKEALNAYSDYLKRELRAAGERRLSLIHALSTTFYIEQSLIEARFFEVFKGGSEKLKKSMSQHRISEKEHSERIRMLIANIKV